MSESELRVWAEAHAPAGCPQAAAVLVLFDHVAALRERLAGQSEILSQRAERRAAPRPDPVELMRLADDGNPLAEAVA